MLNMYFSVLNCGSGFPTVAAIKLVPFREVGDTEAAVNHCIEEFDKYASKCTGEALFNTYRAEMLELAASIKTIEDIATASFQSRTIDGKLLQGVLCVSVRSGKDLHSRRY